MALQKQNVQLSINNGLDTKTDDKNVLAARFLELENCVFTKTGSLTKRNGYEVLSTKDTSGNDIISGKGLASFKDELLLFDGAKVYSYLEGVQKWVEKGSAVSVINNISSIIKNSFRQKNAEFGTLDGIDVYAWEDSRAGIRYSVLDSQSGSFIISDKLISATGADPKIIKLGSFLLIMYLDGPVLKFQSIKSALPSVLQPAVTLGTAVVGVYDVAIGGERIFISWKSSTNGVVLKYLTSTLVQSSEKRLTAETAVDTIGVTCDCLNNVQVYYYTGSDLKYFVYNYELTSQVLAPTIIESITNIKHITGVETDTTTNTQTVLYEIDNPTNNNYIKQVTVTNSGTIGTPSVFLRSVGLYSKIFSTDNDKYVVTAFQSDLQSTYFVMSLSGDIISKIVPQNAGGYKVGPNLTEVYEVSNQIFQFSAIKKHTLITENGVLNSLSGVSAITLDFASTNHYINAEIADSLHIVGGILQSYDGHKITESGFLVFPETVTATTGAGGSAQAGTYQYTALYAWYDNNGQLHRSAPSIPVSVVASGGDSVTVVVPTLRITKKEDVFIEVYGTEANGIIFHKLTTSLSPVFNDKDVDTVSFLDTETDLQKLDNEALYNTGGVLDNISPESSTMITTYKSRLIIGGLEDENTIQYSKERFEGEPISFNDGLKINVDPRGGKMTALANLDNFVIIFKERAIYTFSGEGPNNLGEQNDFRVPQLVTSDAGCIDSNSVVETPQGLMFKSKKGIYLISRGLQVSYIGAPVEAYNDNEITSATLIANTNQVRFTTKDSLTLVYDYFHGAWSTFTNHFAEDSDIFNDKFVYLRSNGEINSEIYELFRDGNQPIVTKIVSSWIQMSGIQGFQRFYRMLILGNYFSKHKLEVKIGYDFNPIFTDSTTIDVGALITQTTYGEDSPYGSEAVFGGDNPLYQWEIYPERQKCQSFRFQIQDFQDQEIGEGFSISNFAMILGIKSGLNKLSDGRGFGTKKG